MTKEQEKKLAEIGEQIQKLFPDMYGSIRFNLIPGRKSANINIDQSFIIDYNDYDAKEKKTIQGT